MKSSEASTSSAVIIRVRGRVQGVGFRWWTRTRATELNLRGTARNREDGSVEIRAFGSPEALERFQRDVHRGPPGASVTDVEVRSLAHTEPPPDFRIIH